LYAVRQKKFLPQISTDRKKQNHTTDYTDQKDKHGVNRSEEAYEIEKKYTIMKKYF
jgi:hypothetical protein